MHSISEVMTLFSDYRLFDTVVCPGMFYITSSLGVLQTLYGEGAVCTLEDAEFASIFVLDESAPEDDRPVANIVVTPTFSSVNGGEDAEVQFGSISIVSFDASGHEGNPENAWTEHFTCRYSASMKKPAHPPSDLRRGDICSSLGPKEALYEQIEAAGFQYGPAFQWMKRVDKTVTPGEYLIHLARGDVDVASIREAVAAMTAGDA